MPEQTQEEYMAECMKDHTKEQCEMMWTQKDSVKAKDFVTVVRELEMEKAKNSQLTKMLKEATDIIKAVNAERDAVTEARKYEMAVEIERDSDGKLKHRDLMTESLNDLTIMKKAIDSAKPKDFISVATMLDESDKKRKPQLSVGEYDPIAKKWKGGI